MSKWRLELRNIGRGKVSKDVIINADTLPMAEGKALRECGRHLMSRDIELIDKTDLTYTVCAGFHSVGQVSIVSI